jgi:opacity protein-like surface antigen
MRRWTVLVALAMAATSAYGIGLGAGGFYALSMPMGDVADLYKMNIIGFGGKVMVGVMPMLNVDVGFGYHMKYKNNQELVIPSEGPGGAALAYDDENWYLTTIPITFGASYPMSFGNMGVYFGGGGAFVMETAHYEVLDATSATLTTESESESKPGFYAGGGFKYYITDKLALDVNPRWMMVLDAKEAAADDPNTPENETVAETSNSMFIDFLIGVDYAFM